MTERSSSIYKTFLDSLFRKLECGLLKMIAYKFEVHESLNFLGPSSTIRYARNLSKLVYRVYSGKRISSKDLESLDHTPSRLGC